MVQILSSDTGIQWYRYYPVIQGYSGTDIIPDTGIQWYRYYPGYRVEGYSGKVIQEFNKTEVGDYINTMKTTLDFNFD